MPYLGSYGRYNTKPDFSRCCESVTPRGEWFSVQCSRPNGHGPQGNYCKQHDPEVREAAKREAEKKHQEKWAKRRYEIHGERFYRILKQIAEGHNDPRGLAQATLDIFHGE